jgi:hypothetical protein
MISMAIVSIPADLISKNPKTQKLHTWPWCANTIIKMTRATFWVLAFAKTQKGYFIESTKTQKPNT